MTEKILFVDDEQNVLDGIQRQLHGEFDVVTALGGEQGLSVMASQGPFALIVADMRMPRMDGLEFLAQARQRDPHAVLMMLTGNADRQTALDAVAIGKVFNFLTKPCKGETLEKALQAGLEMFRLQGQINQIDSFLRKTS